jgi:hypothetical protein
MEMMTLIKVREFYRDGLKDNRKVYGRGREKGKEGVKSTQ